MFDESTFRKPSQFERMKEEIAIQNQEILNSNRIKVLERADLTSRRRDQPSGNSQNDQNDRGGRDDQSDQNDRDDRDGQNGQNGQNNQRVKEKKKQLKK